MEEKNKRELKPLETERAVLERNLKEDANDDVTLARLADVLLQISQRLAENAEIYLERALKENPDKANYYTQKVELLLLFHRNAEACNTFVTMVLKFKELLLQPLGNLNIAEMAAANSMRGLAKNAILRPCLDLGALNADLRQALLGTEKADADLAWLELHLGK